MIKIIQFQVLNNQKGICDSDDIFGLGEDGNVYWWSYGAGQWFPYKINNN